jgi:predicted Zn finger-like uncharacterized protein
MIIPCPACQTKFHLDESRLPSEEARVRCSRCQHVFVVSRIAPKDPPPAPVEGLPPRPNPLPRARRRRRLPLLILGVLGLAAAGLWLADFSQNAVAGKVLEYFSLARQKLGLGEPSEGAITLEKVKGTFLDNQSIGRVFIIEGQAVNNRNESRSFIKIKGALLDKSGGKVEEKTVYCGNILSEKDLREMDRAAIEKSLSSHFGESFANINVPPRKSTPFMLVFMDFNKDAASKAAAGQPTKPGEFLPGLSDFTVEVVSSQKGAPAK